MTARISLVLGGARSGKSQYGERLALETGLTPIYIATAEARDAEMQTRIGHHRDQRDERWSTLEEPLDLASIIAGQSDPARVLFVDCLTLWLSNHLEHGCDLEQESDALCAALAEATGPVILISNEVGQGIVPTNALARQFRDEAGRLHQKVAAICTDVSFIIAGLTLPLKRDGLAIDLALLSKDPT